jgi:hypothetical protein
MPALVMGQVPGALAGDQAARWQAALIGAARRGVARRGAAPLGCPGARDPLRARGCARRWRCSACRFLAHAQLEALTDLSATTDVTVYVLDSCEELIIRAHKPLFAT